MCPGLVMGSRMKLGKLMEYLAVLSTGNKPESRCILGKRAPLEVCKSLAGMLSPKPFRVTGV